MTDDAMQAAGSSYGSRKGRLSETELRGELRKSKFDSVSSLLLALLLIIGLAVGMLFMVWWDRRVYNPAKPMVLLVENPAGRGENAEGFERDFEPPGAEEVEALQEPTMQDTITAVTDAVSSVAAALDSVNATSATTTGTGKGDSRPPGPEGEGEDVIPRFERWQLEFAAKNIGGYAQQLDFYKIELAALGGTQVQGVDYAASLSGTPKVRRGPSDTEKRLYFMWTKPSPLEKFDRQLLQKAGVPLTGREMVKFIDAELENVLANIELDYAKKNGHQSITELAKTVFESQSKNNSFEFVVVEQRYRKPKR